MSTDPTGLRTETSIELIKKKYLNIKFKKEDWCTYGGECMIGDTLHYPPEELCLLCTYRSLIDVPYILDKNKKGDK